jgi:hypothetical protein
MPIEDSYSALGRNSRIADNADEVENMALGKIAASINRSLLNERISGELEDDYDDQNRVIREGPTEEELAGTTLEIIEQRRELLGSAYPFKINGQMLEYTGMGDGVYEFCLRLSLMDHSANQNSIDIVVFELLTAKLVADHFGGEHYRSGWPSHDKADRPSRLAKVGEIIQQKTGEWRWSPYPGNPNDPTIKEAKDGGLDFLVWKRLDARMGSFFVAGQCACGDDWRNKFADHTAEKIQRWWSTPSCVPFTRAFAIPYAIPGHIAIQEISRLAGLVFDRTRLTLASSHSIPAEGWIAWLAANRAKVTANQPTRNTLKTKQPTKPKAARKKKVA